MYPLEFPTAVSVKSLSLNPMNAVSGTKSPFTYKQQVYDWGGEAWAIKGALPLMDRDTAADYRSFMLKLKGRKGTFLFPVHENTPRGTATGLPVVDGAGQVGSNLNIKGFDLNVVGILKSADWIQLGSGLTTSLHAVLDDVDTDGFGNCTVNIWPAIRQSPSDGAVLIVSGCKGLFRLSGDVGVDFNTNKLVSLQSFSAMEVI